MEPVISIMIPTLNSEKTIERCIKSITSQSYSREKYEIIVVDGVSKDNSVKLAEKAGADSVIIENCTLGRSRNIGAKKARGKYFAFLDSDCEVKDGWLDNIEKELATKDAITGPLLNGTKGLIAWAEYFLKFSEFNEYKKESEIEFLMGANQACRKEVYELTGGFSEQLASEDVIFGKYLADAGITCYFIPKMQIVHLGGATTLNNFLAKMKTDGTYIVRNCKIVPSIYTPLTTNKWNIFRVFGIKFGARLIRSRRAKKFGLFVVSLPLIILGITYFCKGFLKEIK